ncbi:MAG: NADH:ubiquinone reductase (Na(+)-transporting) subunit D [Kiritimatiellae bacterium]|nr:NADH:ubiquinone reductase (Na(+)-transporting) subunit D [Kiritimatiellia bacterium]
MSRKPTTQTVLDALWRDNPVFRQILGICSALAVTNLVLNTLVMCAALTFTTALSACTVSLLRRWTPDRIRMMVQTLVIAFYVILIDIWLKAFWPEMGRALGPFVGLIITNCIVMGRCEAFAKANPPGLACLDGLFSGLGYSFVLLSIAVVRELLGMGTLLGVPIPYFSGAWDKWIIMVMPPGAFFTLACVVWFFRSIRPEKEDSGA